MSATLLLGGARSGKSRYAEELAAASGKSKIYLATAEPGDAEMAARIARHRTDRGASWRTIEEPMNIAELLGEGLPHELWVVDCLTLWMSNIMHKNHPIAQQIATLISAVENAKADIVLVSNEVGLGIVPENAMARAYRDHLGALNQALARVCGRVVLMVAGLPMAVK